MKQIAVLSGKGGTGKTILTGSFAVLARNKVMVDCDVDAADLHILLKPSVRERYDFQAGKLASIDMDACLQCKICINLCRFKAIDNAFKVKRIDCEGCGFCYHACPVGAVRMDDKIAGEWFVSDTKYGTFVHAKLGIAEDNSGKLAAKIRGAAKDIAERENLEYVIIDGPPGVGCPVMATLAGIDLAVLVTEPTLSGLHDMSRVCELTAHFKIPTAVVVNKYDLNTANTDMIQKSCAERGIKVIGKIPFSPDVCASVVNCTPYPEYSNGDICDIIVNIWNTAQEMVLGK
ncbi:MAG: ATP-binding protein [Candidatus Auribacterota bacterium]